MCRRCQIQLSNTFVPVFVCGLYDSNARVEITESHTKQRWRSVVWHDCTILFCFNDCSNSVIWVSIFLLSFVDFLVNQFWPKSNVENVNPCPLRDNRTTQLICLNWTKNGNPLICEIYCNARNTATNVSRTIFGWNLNAEKTNAQLYGFFFANLRTAKLFTIHWLDIIQFCCIITSFRFACKQLRLANSVLSFFLIRSFCLDARRTMSSPSNSIYFCCWIFARNSVSLRQIG